MDFRFTDEQDMIAEMIGSVLRDKCSTADLRKMVGAGQTFDTERWNALAELGLCSVLIPEDIGGMGLSEIEFVRVAETCGAYLLPEPLIESSGVSLPLLAELSRPNPGLEQSLEALVAGAGHVALFHPSLPLAAHANSAQVILSSDDTGDVFYGTPSEMDIAAQPCADPLTPLFSIGSGGQKLENGPNNIHEALARAHNRGALFAAAQMLGVAQAALDITVEYSKERQQFGRPIGGNQAVKHLLAEVQVGIEFLRPVVYAAAAMLANGNQNASAHISHARLRAAEVVQLATERAIQVHGAMGYSWEADVHLFLKRGMVLTQQWGTTDQHFDRVAERAIQSGELASDKLFGT